LVEIVSPEVHIVGRPSLDIGGIWGYLDTIGADEWDFAESTDEERTDEDRLVELFGRLCYKSFGVGLNPNVTRVREDPKAYLENVLASGHGSVLEHASISVVFTNVSRVFTHELVRHRAGTAMSQESLRFVRLDRLKFWMPPEIIERPEVRERAVALLEQLEDFQTYLAEAYNVESLPFDQKKKLTSTFRRFAPIGLATSIAFTGNVRAWRHIIEMRTSRHAEQEMRLVIDELAQYLHDEVPLLFGDFVREEIDGIGEWTTPYSKV